MYKSKEIRWFLPHEQTSIIRWFKSLGGRWAQLHKRTDFYLLLEDKEDIGIKIREGRVEVKHRNGTPQLKDLLDGAVGYLEDWTKWSFVLDDADEASREVILGKRDQWIAVHKKRRAVIISLDEHGEKQIVDLNTPVDFGCQIEFTQLEVAGKESFTFGLEWFGTPQLKLDIGLLSTILSETILPREISMGYAEYLLQD